MHVHGWNLFFLIAFIVYVAIRGFFDRHTKRNEKLITKVDQLERALLVAVGVGSIALPLLYSLHHGWHLRIINGANSDRVAGQQLHLAHSGCSGELMPTSTRTGRYLWNCGRDIN